VGKGKGVNREQVVAHHEAGHAVVATMLGFRPTMLSIRPRADTAGRHGPALTAALDECSDDAELVDLLGWDDRAGDQSHSRRCRAELEPVEWKVQVVTVA
jgi:hypothetical protein